MQVSFVNDVKVYNLSAGKSFPEVSDGDSRLNCLHCLRYRIFLVDIGKEETVVGEE